MPLIILGLLVLIGILAYSIVRYINSGEEDTRPVRERYPKAFPPREHSDGSGNDNEVIHAEGYVDSDSIRGDIDYMLRNIRETVSEKAKEHGIDLDKLGRDKEAVDNTDEGGEDKTIIFPSDNVEEEKQKRNIH